jgi:hypothetical protein
MQRIRSIQGMNVAGIGGVAFTGEGGPEVVVCVDEFGPFDLQAGSGRACARPTTAPGGVRHLLAAHDLGRDRLYGHVGLRKN